MCVLNTHRRIGVFVVVAACAGASPASAQVTPTPPDRPAQGLYRGDQPDNQSRQSLLLSGSLAGAYDTHVVGADTIGVAPVPGVTESGYYSSANVDLFYGKNSSNNRVMFGSNVDSTFAYYPKLTRDIKQPVDSYQGGASLSAQLGRTRLRLAQTLGYQPYFLLQTLPSATLFVNSINLSPDSMFMAPSPLEFSPRVSILNKPSTVYSSAASFTAPLGRRSSVDFTYGYQGSKNNGLFADISSQSAGVQLRHAVGRSTEIYESYTYQVSTYRPLASAGTDIRQHSVEIGVSQRRRLSATRSLRIYAGGGASTLDGQFFATADNQKSHQATAHAGLDLQFARSWTTRAEFTRSLQLLQGLAQPYFGNAVSFDVHGGLGRRVDLAAGARYSQGFVDITSVAADSAARSYDTRRASLRLRYALSRQLALFAEYINTQYRFGSGAVLPVGVIRRLDRHAVQVGLTWGVSLLGGRSARP